MHDPDEDDREEGEIEDGEIIESGEENEERNGRGSSGGGHDGQRSMMELLYMEMEGKDDASQKKKKRKRKRKRKTNSPERFLGAKDDGTKPPKSKKARYIDHDRVMVNGENSWGKPTYPPGPAVHPVIHGLSRAPNDDSRYPGWSPDRLSPDENDPLSKRMREKSPPGLYDSPYESDDGLAEDGKGGPMFQSVGNFERDFRGDVIDRQGAPNKKQRRKKMKGDKRGGKRMDDKDNRRKNQRPLAPSDTQHLICKFYLEGKCAKGDVCNYSHDISNKKMELCKFYLNGFCSKIESCIYLHNEFPCKFFHTGAKCYSGDNCKFSHDVLTEDLKKALDNHLLKDNKNMGSPKGGDGECGVQQRPHRPSLLGSPPQHIKDLVMRKKIPSLFDLDIKPPAYQPAIGLSAGPPQPPDSRASAPGQGPPNVPTTQGPAHSLLPTPNSDFRGAGRGEMRLPLLPLPNPAPDANPRGYYNHDQDMRAPFSETGPEYDSQSFIPPNRFFDNDPAMMDVDERYPVGLRNDSDDLLLRNEYDDEDERVHEMARHPDKEQHDNQPFAPIPWKKLAVLDVDMRANSRDEETSESNVKDFYSKAGGGWDKAKESSAVFGAGLDSNSSTDSEDEAQKKETSQQPPTTTNIPLHLPKKQRELFMRIQQREAANKTVSDSDENKKNEESSSGDMGLANGNADTGLAPSEEDQEAEKEKWYSSSEDDDDDNDQPLAAMLKKLQQQPLQKPLIPPPTIVAAAASTNDSSIMQLSKILQTIASKTSTTTPSAPAKVDPRRDPRRDPRSSRPIPTPAALSSSSPLAAKAAESKVKDPRTKVHRPSVTPPQPPVAQPQPSSHFNANPISYSDTSLSSSSSSPSSSRGLTSNSLASSRPHPPPAIRPTEPPKPKPIISRKRSSTSEDDIVEIRNSGSSASSSANSTYSNPLIPYKLKSISSSVPNYSSVVHSMDNRLDPKLLLTDPRLKKELANEFSVLSSSSSTSTSEQLTTSSLLPSASSVQSKELSAGVSSAKVRVGQHRLGVATMPAPRSSQLKKPPTSTSVTGLKPLSLIRSTSGGDQPERSTTPPLSLFGFKHKDLSSSLKDSLSSSNSSLLQGSKEESSEKVVMEQSILSPTAEPTSKFHFPTHFDAFSNKNKNCDSNQSEVSMKQEVELPPASPPPKTLPVKVKEEVVDAVEQPKAAEEEEQKTKGEEKLAAEAKAGEMKVEADQRLAALEDSFQPFNEDDMDDDDKSESDLVIVETPPEVDKAEKAAADKAKKAKKVHKQPQSKKTTTTPTKAASSSAEDKKPIFMVAQVGDGTCIKIKMIKPTKPEEKKKEKEANGKKTGGAKHKAATRSFEDALNAHSEQNTPVAKKGKKQAVVNNSAKHKSKTKSSKKD